MSAFFLFQLSAVLKKNITYKNVKVEDETGLGGGGEDGGHEVARLARPTHAPIHVLVISFRV
jgi:hypothetical protein